MILDLFAGADGWGCGARMLGLNTVGLERDQDACRTAVRAGGIRIRCDVTTYPTWPFAGKVTGLIGSPPCQPWSKANNRSTADERTDLAFEPVRWIRDLLPAWVALEEVPAVIPRWLYIARRLAPWGYHSWVGLLNAADYGVPQIRPRAILLAAHHRPIGPPLTHRPWITAADGLHWPPATGQPPATRTGHQRDAADEATDPASWMRTRPATVVASRGILVDPGTNRNRSNGAVKSRNDGVRLTPAEAGALQSFPADYPWTGGRRAQHRQVGNAVPPLLAAHIIAHMENVAAPV